MPVIYSTDALTGRLQGLATQMASGSIVFYDGSTTIATATLANPAATASAGILEFSGTPLTTTAIASGTIDSASILDASSNILIENLTVGPPETTANVIISNGHNNMVAILGQTVSVLGGYISSVSNVGDEANYTTSGWDARFTGLVNVIDANGPGGILIRDGTTALGTVHLVVPSGSVSGGVLTFLGGLTEAFVPVTGYADNAVIVDGLGTEIVTGLTVGIPGTSSDIVINNGLGNTLISVGQVLILTSATITEN